MLRNRETLSIGRAPSQRVCPGSTSQWRKVGTAAPTAKSAPIAHRPKAKGVAMLAWSTVVLMMPTPMIAGMTDAAKKATAQIALLRIFRLVPKGASLTLAFEVAFRLEIGQRQVKRLVQATEEIAQFGLVDDQRRADRDAIT